MFHYQFPCGSGHYFQEVSEHRCIGLFNMLATIVSLQCNQLQGEIRFGFRCPITFPHVFQAHYSFFSHKVSFRPTVCLYIDSVKSNEPSRHQHSWAFFSHAVLLCCAVSGHSVPEIAVLCRGLWQKSISPALFEHEAYIHIGRWENFVFAP